MKITPEQNPGTPPRVALRIVPFDTQEEINHMAPTILIAMHNMANKIEDETLPWYLFNAVFYPYIGLYFNTRI